MDRTAWYRLDNVGKFYASQAGSSTQTVFRYSATMTTDVDASALQRALEQAIEVYPGFNVCLRSGMFWHYLEPASKPPHVAPENLPVCFGLHVHAKSVLFRVSYFRARINLEVSHIVSDGRGTLDFFKAILSSYVAIRHQAKTKAGTSGTTLEQKAENSFDKYYERDKAASTRMPWPYRLPGRRNTARPLYFEYHLPAARVKELARSMGVSVTSLLIAAVVCAVRDGMRPRDRHRPIRLDVPVDLRSFFASSTAKNFFGLAFVSYTPENENEPLEAVARSIQRQIQEGTKPENLKARMNRMIALEKNPALRLAPLFVKDLALDAANAVAARQVTTTVSSIGVIRLDDAVAPYVKNINVITSSTGLNFIACTFKDDLSIGVSTALANPAAVSRFCRIFSSYGIEGYANTVQGGTR